MLVDLSAVFASGGKEGYEGITTELQVPLEMTEFAGPMGSFPILEKTPVALKLQNIGGGKAEIEGNVKLVFRTQCDRCLAEVETPMELSFERTAVAPEAEGEEEDSDDSHFMEGYQLNVETLVYDEILLNWPMKILCREDCKGVCPVCGRNRNEGDCGCDTFVPDSRLAALQDIFKADKEV